MLKGNVKEYPFALPPLEWLPLVPAICHCLAQVFGLGRIGRLVHEPIVFLSGNV